MDNYSPWLYYDRENHTWRFYLKNNGELIYSIMYEEDKWTKENVIDSEVVDFAVNINSEYKVYLIYSVKGGELKYCIWENDQWLGRTLYRLENPDFQMTEINVCTIRKDNHVFFVARSISKKIKYPLMHFCWNNERRLSTSLKNIAYLQERYDSYQIELSNNGDLFLLFLNDGKNEVNLKLTTLKNKGWSIPRRLYGINGTDIHFYSLLHNGNINILNLSKEDTTYSMEHVLIMQDGRMLSNKIYSSSIKPNNYFLLEINGVLWAIWSEENKILSSSYENQWSLPIEYDIKLQESFSMYKYISSNSKNKNLRGKCVFGTLPPEINLLLPGYIKNKDATDWRENSEDLISDKTGSSIEEVNSKIEEGITTIKESKINLEKKIISLQLQLQQMQRIVEESEGNFVKLASSKKKLEEKLNLITEIHEVSINNLEGIKKQQIARENTINELKRKLEDSARETDELKIELKYEKNKGLIDRIMKRKLDR